MSGEMLEGKRALVTGAIQGIGMAVAQSLAKQGCSIVLHGLAAIPVDGGWTAQ